VLGFWSYNNLTLAGTPPYLDMPSIGWDDYSNTGRGYVPGRYTGKNLFYLESEYRFGLTRNGLLGGVVFGNAESILKSTTSKLNAVIPGGGFGLRIKVNKHSNTNVAIDYGFGIGGSHGFFFNLGEVF
jgi:hemolysin activation/secretion protein